jgi:hypothetical protein
MNIPAPRELVLSPSGMIEAEKARGALTLLFGLDKANIAAKKEDDERRIKESMQCIEEMNKILEKKLG